jgi:hypothetical protein
VGLSCNVLSECQVCVTDCHGSVLTRLRENAFLNEVVHLQYHASNPGSCRSACATMQASSAGSIEVCDVDWTTFSEEQAFLVDADLVVASDVVFDVAVLPDLARTIQRLLIPSCSSTKSREAIVAATVRNEATLQSFLEHVNQSQLCYKELALPDMCVLMDNYFLTHHQSIPVKIFRIVNALNSHLLNDPETKLLVQ